MNLEHVDILQRLFTAEGYKYLVPIKLKKKMHHNTAIISKDEITINDIINRSPEILYPIDKNFENWTKSPVER